MNAKRDDDEPVIAATDGLAAIDAPPAGDPTPADDRDHAEDGFVSPSSDAADSDITRLHLHMPVDVRSVSLAIIAVLACVYALHWAKAVVVPVLLGVMLSYALTPLVDRLASWRLPRAAGAGLLLSGLIATLAWGVWSMSDDATTFVATMPEMAQKMRQAMRGSGGKQVDTIAKVQEAAAEITHAADEAAAAASAASAPAAGASAGGRTTTTTTTTTGPRRPPPVSATTPNGVTRVVLARPDFDVRDYLWTGTLGLAAFLGQTMVVFLVAFFLMASGNNFRRKMVKLAGPKLSQKRVTIQALDEITTQIQRYLMVQLATSAVVGVATGLAFLAIGLDHAGVWGVVAGITNLIPYVGAVIVGAGSAALGLIQFGTADMALLVGGSSFAIHALVGNLLTPWWTGRASRMSPFAVFVGVLAFGWLWGAVGLILGVPILMVVKTVCDRVDELKPVGEFLGA